MACNQNPNGACSEAEGFMPLMRKGLVQTPVDMVPMRKEELLLL